MTPEDFYADPPWAGGRGGIRMGLRPIPTERWLIGRITDEERAEKLALLRDHRDVVLRAEAGSETGQREIAAAVADALRTALPEAELPIEAASLLVPDDLCLMQRRGDRYVLTAACVCAPSYWVLADKTGKALDAIHARVPSLNERIGAQMQRFFEALPTAQIFERRNWSIHPTDTLFQPEYDIWARTTTFDRLYVRSERQTLRRLAPDTIVFTIRVTVVPLEPIQRFPSAAADLLAAFERMTPIDRENSSLERYVDVLKRIVSP
jgi:hypothetical protein